MPCRLPVLQQDGACVWEEDPQGADRAPPKAQEASPGREHRGSGASASGPDPHQKGPRKFTPGRQRKEVCAKIPRLSHLDKYFAQCFLTAWLLQHQARHKIWRWTRGLQALGNSPKNTIPARRQGGRWKGEQTFKSQAQGPTGGRRGV